MKIKSTCCSVIGRGHIKNGMPCQDYSYTFKKGDFAILVVCDGAGSCKHSREGAEVVARTITKMIFKKFDTFYYFISNSNNNGNILVSYLIVNKVKNELKKKAKKLNTNLKELSSTLMFIAVKDCRYICGHIGDGVIGISKNGKFEVLSEPDNSEFANITYFITGDYAVDKLKLYIGNCRDIEGFIAMTDGSTTMLYDKKNKKLARACDKILNYLKKNSERTTKRFLRKLITEKIAKGTFDDCSIGVLHIHLKKSYNNYIKSKIKYNKEILYTHFLNKINRKKYKELFNRGLKYYRNAMFEEALTCFETILKNIENIDDNTIIENSKKCIINIYCNLGNYNYKIGNYEKARDYYIKAKSKCLEFGFDNKISIFEDNIKKCNTKLLNTPKLYTQHLKNTESTAKNSNSNNAKNITKNTYRKVKIKTSDGKYILLSEDDYNSIIYNRPPQWLKVENYNPKIAKIIYIKEIKKSGITFGGYLYKNGKWEWTEFNLDVEPIAVVTKSKNSFFEFCNVKNIMNIWDKEEKCEKQFEEYCKIADEVENWLNITIKDNLVIKYGKDIYTKNINEELTTYMLKHGYAFIKKRAPIPNSEVNFWEKYYWEELLKAQDYAKKHKLGVWAIEFSNIK